MGDAIYLGDGSRVIRTSDALFHEGRDHIESTVGRGSGRYAWGSGENPGQHLENMRAYEARELLIRKHPDWEEADIAAELGYSSAAKLKSAIKKQKTEDLRDMISPKASGGDGMSFQEAAEKLWITPSEGKKFLKKEKPEITELEIAEALGYSSTGKLRDAIQASNTKLKAQQMAKLNSLMAPKEEGGKGLTLVEASRMMGVPESTARDWLDPQVKERNKVSANIVNVLKRELDERDIVGLDIGLGASNIMGVTPNNLSGAVAALVQEGYKVHTVKTEQLHSGNMTNTKVLTKPGVEWKDVRYNQDKIGIINDRSNDGGHSLDSFHEASFDKEKMQNISSKKIMVRYSEEGGSDRDGTIELRPGAPGLDMGSNRYCQVRIGVDGTHYMKGMAIYGDPKDFPKGIDVIYNTNKSKGTPLMAFKEDGSPGKFKGEVECVLKPQDLDPEASNPFGSAIKVGAMRGYSEGFGGQRGYLNIMNEQGDWHEWSRTLSSQFLSKQPEKLIKEQLGYKKMFKQEEYEEIESIINPVVKRKLLLQFADKCDADAEDLKAAAMSRQTQSVIIPITSLKEDEIYAPQYNTGETVVLIRHPHAGQFEIPELKVNNRNREGSRVIGRDSVDAIGIHPKTAAVLSGADFDGDSVVVIPNNDKRVKTRKPYDALMNFDPKTEFPPYPGMKKVGATEEGGDGFHTQNEMGRVSNLITDMTLKGAALNSDEIIRAVKYSMVVIDAEKHQLDWNRAKEEFRIDDLKRKYQGVNPNGSLKGASTIISRAKSPERIPLIVKNSKNILPDGTVTWKTADESKRVYTKYIDRKTGARVYNPSEEDISSGRVKAETRKLTTSMPKMRLAKDASELSSGTRKEGYYVDYANAMKDFAKKARSEAVNMELYSRSKSAADAYAAEVESLNAKYNLAMREKPYERRAQRLAGAITKQQIKANPSIKEDKDSYNKLKRRNLSAARQLLRGSRQRYQIDITNREWEAIQAHAISPTRLEDLLDVTPPDIIRQRAIPRNESGLTKAQIATAKRLLKNDNYTIADVASRLGVSPSTLSKHL